MKTSILILDAPPAEGSPERTYFERAGLEVDIIDARECNRTEIEEAFAKAEAVFTWHAPLDAGQIALLKQCQMIMHYGPGAEPDAAQIDLEAARRAGIYVVSTPDYASDLWAGHCWEMLVEGAKKLSRRRPAPWRRKRLALVGFGQVARRLADRARSEGMRTYAYDPFVDPEFFTQHDTIQVHSLEELCGMAQVLSLHAPLVPPTRAMIGPDQLRMMAPGSLLLCNASQALLNAEALGKALTREAPALALFGGTTPRPPSPLPEGAQWIGFDAEASRADALARREAAAETAIILKRGGRPPHLRLDPPCPRQVLAMAEQVRIGA